MTPEQRERAQRMATLLPQVADNLDLSKDVFGAYGCRETSSLLRELLAQDSEDERGAARYQWLRGGKARTTGLPKDGRIEIMQWEDRCEANVLRGEALDAAVDAAIAKEQK